MLTTTKMLLVTEQGASRTGVRHVRPNKLALEALTVAVGFVVEPMTVQEFLVHLLIDLRQSYTQITQTPDQLLLLLRICLLTADQLDVPTNGALHILLLNRQLQTCVCGCGCL